MKRAFALVPAIACLVVAASAPAAFGATAFQPRVASALGLAPPVNYHGTVPSELGVSNPVTYHGGPTMDDPIGVTVHTIFWAPSGFAFQGSPGAGIPTYEGMIEQYYTDVAAASTQESGATSACGPSNQSVCDDFTVEPQYGSGTSGAPTSGVYTINYSDNGGTAQTYSGGGAGTLNDTNDLVVDTDPYPTAGNGTGQCSSPQDAKACILDSALQAEVDKIVQATTGTPRGLTNLWYVFLPPDVDECISQDVCGTNAFGGYHSLSNYNGHGLTIYALTIDPIIEVGAIAPGADPEGNPDAEVAVDIADHETNEAMSDPTGTGWIDPNAYEIGDKCEFGSQHGTPLGFATDGSPYDQLVNGDEYYTQEIWSQADGGCVQASEATITDSGLPLPTVNLTQFSPVVTGNIGGATPASGVPVEVQLLRNTPIGAQEGIFDPEVVADQTTTTGADGSWSVTLQHAVGDDRDEIDVVYNGGNPGTGVPAQPHEVILTGNGGNPFIEGGWMGFSDMDNGANVAANTLTLAPCFQTGVLASPVTTETPTDFCNTSLDTAAAATNTTIDASTPVTWSSTDNRAAQPGDTVFSTSGLSSANSQGALVTLTVPAGEPGSASAQGSFMGSAFTPSGFPTCTAELGAQMVICSGLVPGGSYTVNGVGATAVDDGNPGDGVDGTVTVSTPVHGGDTVVLKNGANRTLSTLHVADLQVHINGASGSPQGSAVASGTCSSDEYWGGPLSGPVGSAEAGEFGNGGPAGTGEICVGGDPTGLPTSTIAQTDDQSGGETVTEVGDVAETSPIDGETVYGAFTALALPSGESSTIGLTITDQSGDIVFQSGDVTNGASVRALTPGGYKATWTVTNANGDTRTVSTRFIEQSPLQGPQGAQGSQGTQGATGAQGPRGPQGPPGPKPTVRCTLEKHGRIKCTVSYPRKKGKKGKKGKSTKGHVAVVVTRGGRIVALGQTRLVNGRASMTMRELRAWKRGKWEITLVQSRSANSATTQTMTIRVR